MGKMKAITKFITKGSTYLQNKTGKILHQKRKQENVEY